MNPDATGTVYGLRDPRDGVTRYIGATTKTLTARLSGHLGGKAAPRVRAWVAELRAAGLRPETYAIKEGVPADELLAGGGQVTGLSPRKSSALPWCGAAWPSRRGYPRRSTSPRSAPSGRRSPCRRNWRRVPDME